MTLAARNYLARFIGYDSPDGDARPVYAAKCCSSTDGNLPVGRHLARFIGYDSPDGDARPVYTTSCCLQRRVLARFLGYDSPDGDARPVYGFQQPCCVSGSGSGSGAGSGSGEGSGSSGSPVTPNPTCCAATPPSTLTATITGCACSPTTITLTRDPLGADVCQWTGTAAVLSTCSCSGAIFNRVVVFFRCTGTTIDDFKLDLCLQTAGGLAPKNCSGLGVCGVNTRSSTTAVASPFVIVYNLTALESFCGIPMVVTITT